MINNKNNYYKCRDCNHFGYCSIYWGAECKRHGGTRTPRLKSINQDLKHKTEAGSKHRNQQIVLDQPIRTKVVNWQ